MTAEHFPDEPSHPLESEAEKQVKVQLRAAWRQLPDEEKAAMTIELLEDAGEEGRLSFRESLDTRWPITSDSIPATFGLIMIIRDDLAQIGLVEDETKLFDDEQLQKMSTEIRDHYVVQGFWEELKYHTMHFLGGLRKQNQKSE